MVLLVCKRVGDSDGPVVAEDAAGIVLVVKHILVREAFDFGRMMKLEDRDN